MSKEENKYFFSNFTSIREKKGITLEDIVKKTKLQKNYIIAIENGKFNILPKAYIKLFLKTYAKFLDLDIQKILNSYDEHISGKIKKRRTISSSTPQFIENKVSFKDNINPNFKTELYKNSYFIEPKKIISLFIFIILIIGLWLLASLVTNQSEVDEIKHNNEPMSWNFYANKDKFVLFDYQEIEIKNIVRSNAFRYESTGSPNSLIIGKIEGESIILEGKVYDERIFEGLTKFGIRNGHIKFYINNSQIEFKHENKAIWGILDPEKNNYLILEYYTYKR